MFPCIWREFYEQAGLGRAWRQISWFHTAERRTMSAYHWYPGDFCSGRGFLRPARTSLLHFDTVSKGSAVSFHLRRKESVVPVVANFQPVSSTPDQTSRRAGRWCYREVSRTSAAFSISLLIRNEKRQCHFCYVDVKYFCFAITTVSKPFSCIMLKSHNTFHCPPSHSSVRHIPKAHNMMSW